MWREAGDWRTVGDRLRRVWRTSEERSRRRNEERRVRREAGDWCAVGDRLRRVWRPAWEWPRRRSEERRVRHAWEEGIWGEEVCFCNTLLPSLGVRRTVSSRDMCEYMASWVRSPPPLPRRAIRARSSEGAGPGSIPFANSPAGGGDDARPPRWLAVVVKGFVLFPGSRHRGGDGGRREAQAHL